MTHYMKLHPEPMKKIISGKKTIEMRLYDEKRKQITKSDVIIFSDLTDNNIKITTEVINIYHFSSFYELYSNFDKVSLGYNENEFADPLDMEQYYTKENIMKYGVIGIEIILKL